MTKKSLVFVSWISAAVRQTSRSYRRRNTPHAVIPIAGDQITNDIAMALRTPTQDAEDIKVKHVARCANWRTRGDRGAGVGERGPRMLSRQTLAEVIEPRVEELYSLVQAELRRSGFEDLLSSGIVITGGSSAMQGMVELGEEIFHMPVRLGIPKYVGGLSDVVKTPRMATGLACCYMAWNIISATRRRGCRQVRLAMCWQE